MTRFYAGSLFGVSQRKSWYRPLWRLLRNMNRAEKGDKHMDDIQIGDLVQVNIVARIVDKYGRTSLTIDYLGHRFTIHSQEVVGVVEPAIHKAAKKQEVK